MSIYKKIRESKKTALKKLETQSVMGNAFEAVAAGAKVVSDQDKNKKGGGDSGAGIGQVAKIAGMLTGGASPITYKSSALRKNGDPNETVNYRGKQYRLSSNDYIEDGVAGGNVNVPDAISGGEADNKWENSMKSLFEEGASIQQLVDKGHGTTEGLTNLFKGLKQGSNSSQPGSKTTKSNITPVMETKTTPASQQYNMGEKEAENANWAEGRMRRGTRRAERRANRDIRRYEQGSKGFLGLGKGKGKGELSSNVLAAAEKTGLKADKLKEMGLNVNDKGSITGDADQNVTDQMRSRATNLSMNKYNTGIGQTTYTPSSSETSHVDANNSFRTITDDDLKDKVTIFDQENSDSNNTFDFSKYGMKNYADEFRESTNKVIEGLPSFTGLNKKGYKGKNAKAFKNKSGRGAGY